MNYLITRPCSTQMHNWTGMPSIKIALVCTFFYYFPDWFCTKGINYLKGTIYWLPSQVFCHIFFYKAIWILFGGALSFIWHIWSWKSNRINDLYRWTHLVTMHIDNKINCRKCVVPCVCFCHSLNTFPTLQFGRLSLKSFSLKALCIPTNGSLPLLFCHL